MYNQNFVHEMRPYMKNVLTLILLVIAQPLFAEKLIFENNGQDVDITGDAQINFETGDITVTTVGEHLIVDAEVPIILGFYPSDYDISIGSSITVTWSVAFADSCTASTPSGTVSSWNGIKNSANGTWSQSGLTVSQLPAQLQLSCSNNTDTVVQTINLSEQTSGGGGSTPTINSFRVNGSANFAIVNPPGSAAIAWTTTDVNSCTASASPAVSGWSGSVATSGNANVTISEDTTLTLNCDGQIATVDVDYSLNAGCTTGVYPTGGSSQTLAVVQDTYDNINDGQPFGASTNTSFELSFGTDEFVTLTGFSLPTDNTRRRMVFENAPTNYNLMSSATMSVSECPGDFTSSALCVIQVTNTSTVFMTTDHTSPQSWCHLDHNKTYYINFVLTPSPYTQQPACASSQHSTCAIFYTEAQ